MKKSNRYIAMLAGAIALAAMLGPRELKAGCIRWLVESTLRSRYEGPGLSAWGGTIAKAHQNGIDVILRALDQNLHATGLAAAEEDEAAGHPMFAFDPGDDVVIFSSRDGNGHRYIESRLKLALSTFVHGHPEDANRDLKHGSLFGARGEAVADGFASRLLRTTDGVGKGLGLLFPLELSRALLVSLLSAQEVLTPLAVLEGVLSEGGNQAVFGGLAVAGLTASAFEFRNWIRDAASNSTLVRRGIMQFANQVRWNIHTVEDRTRPAPQGEVLIGDVQPHNLEPGEIYWIYLKADCATIEFGFTLDAWTGEPQIVMIHWPTKMRAIAKPPRNGPITRLRDNVALTSSHGPK